MSVEYTLMILLLLCAVYILPSVHGFCVYNHSKDTSFYMRQETPNTGGTYWSRFKVESLKPDDRACCPYTSFDCDRNSNPDDIVFIAFRANRAGAEVGYTFSINLPAGGWIEFYSGGPGDPQFNVFKPNGEPFNYEFQKYVKNTMLN
ncbi:unnamed protein product [Mucor circinelloides]|uniref:Uncharacterized protein n=1 Tax=Mucor circinelloides f. circinelloides (strain 1006PhL) TaxID=1220926 RepID=S2JKY3_MUCC1|nr:hypothetical protein HMPREF1544_02245 [Mucor circinelloides 1006PhL]